MKKILMYVNSMNMFGGIERVISNLSSKFSESYEVSILVKDNPISVYHLNGNVGIESINTELIMDMKSRGKRIWNVLINIIKSRNALKKYLKTHSYDYVYTAVPANGFEFYLADKRYRKKIIASEHASYYAYNMMYKKIKEWLYPRLKMISVPTTMDYKIYRDLGYNVTYIPHINTFDVIHNNSLKSKRIINVGRLTADKQQLLLLDIWELVEKRIPGHGWILQIIGSGEEEKDLKRKIEALKLCNVEMIPHTSNINCYYQDAELFVFTSKMEGFGMVLLEAMSYGIPCISFDCPSGPRDIIRHGKNGYLVECYNKEIFANWICEYITFTDDIKRQLSNGAINTINQWNNDKIVNQWIDIFENKMG